MARNGSGTFAVLNPILIGALRSSTAVNQDFVDAGNEITNSLPRDGQAGMSGPLKLANGSQTAPALTFGADTNVGFRRYIADEMRWVSSGVDRMGIDAAGKATFYFALDAAGAVVFDGELGGTSDASLIEALDGTGLAARPEDGEWVLSKHDFIIPLAITNIHTDIATGVRGVFLIPFAMTITGIAIAADQAGSMVLDIKKCTYSGYPTATSICASAKPTLDEQATYSDIVLSGWTKSVAAGDILVFEIESLDNISRLAIDLQCRRFV